ncbi:MAG TPA: DUF222 domain-containing protein, partial [Streptosporangiaceae bacterium]
MCGGQEPVSVAGALAMLERALAALNAADVASLPTPVQAQALRVLERAEARHTAARARVLAAFTARDGYEDDGQGSARVWLRWQTRVSGAAAAGAVGWSRRLATHPVVAAALAEGELSASWARAVCGWSDRLPGDVRGDADQILVAAAVGGAELADLAGLAQHMYERARSGAPDGDGDDDGFDDRRLVLDLTFGGAGRLSGDLTPGCSAAVSAVLEALGRPAGPEDLRTVPQRRHDALEEACRRLIAAGMVPGRAGQPTQAQVHITLAQLRALPGASEAEAAWRASAAARGPGWLSGPHAGAAACDATIAPIVSGHVDPAALDRLVQVFLAAHGQASGPGGGHDDSPGGNDGGPSGNDGGPSGKQDRPAKKQDRPSGKQDRPSGKEGGPGKKQDRPGGRPGRACGCRCGGCTCGTRAPLPAETVARLRGSLLALAADVLSGPGGLAAWLRQSQLRAGPGATASLPLDVPLPLDAGEAGPAIPAHLRRAAVARHPHCAFPGCGQPSSVCQIHHLTPRSQGGPAALGNLVPLCGFHHLTVIHRWGWTLRLKPDGTTTATSPDGRRTCHSHGPP